MRVRKKQIEVEARQFTFETKDRCLVWASQIQQNIYPSFENTDRPCLLIPTLEGEMTASLGDWLIVEPFPMDWRKIYPCKPDIFEKTYEAILPGQA